MARREYQDPSLLTRQGKHGEEYYLRYRVRTVVVGPDGRPKVVRRQRFHVLGLTSELTRRQAERERAKVLAEVNAQVYTLQSQVPVGEFLKVYREVYLPTLAVPTQRTYEAWLRAYVEPALGNVRLCDVGSREVQGLLNGLALAGSTKASLRRVLSGIFRLAKEWGYYSGDNPVARTTLGKVRPKWEKRLLTPEQLQLLLLAVNEDVRLLIELLVSTGARISEALGLRWKAVDFSSGVVYIRERQCRRDVGATKTESSERGLPADEELMAKLAARRGEPDEYVFHKPTGEPFVDNELLANYLTPILRKLGLKQPGMGWHMFRRLHLTWYNRIGKDAFATMHQAGHTSMETTKEYIIGDIEARRETAAAVRRALLEQPRPKSVN